MSTPAAFKKAMQQLTTTIVKAEREGGDDLKSEVRAQLEKLLMAHAEMTADASSDARQHQNWFEQTVARARAIVGEQS